MLDDVASIKTDTLRIIRRALLVARGAAPADGETYLLAQPYLALTALLPPVSVIEEKITKHAAILPMVAAVLAKQRSLDPERYEELVGLIADLGYGDPYERTMAPLVTSSGPGDRLVAESGLRALQDLVTRSSASTVHDLDDMARLAGFEVHKRPKDMPGDDSDDDLDDMARLAGFEVHKRPKDMPGDDSDDDLDDDAPPVIVAARELEAAALEFAAANAAWNEEADAKGATGAARRQAVAEETDDRLITAQHALLAAGSTYERSRAASEDEVDADEHGVSPDDQRLWKQAIADVLESYGLPTPAGGVAEVYDRLFTRVDLLADQLVGARAAAADDQDDDVRVV